MCVCASIIFVQRDKKTNKKDNGTSPCRFNASPGVAISLTGLLHAAHELSTAKLMSCWLLRALHAIKLELRKTQGLATVSTAQVSTWLWLEIRASHHMYTITVESNLSPPSRSFNKLPPPIPKKKLWKLLQICM